MVSARCIAAVCRAATKRTGGQRGHQVGQGYHQVGRERGHQVGHQGHQVGRERAKPGGFVHQGAVSTSGDAGWCQGITRAATRSAGNAASPTVMMLQ